MDWHDTEEQAAFRQEVRSFIDEHLPDWYRRGGPMSIERRPDGAGGAWQKDRMSGVPGAREAADAWAHALSKKGWIAPSWSKEYGGAGLSPMFQFIFNQEMARCEAPAVGGVGTRQIGPAIIVHGTEEQKRQHLGKLLAGESAWAQGYSEPGAGSDLAALQTRAVHDGDDYVVNGQKIWTTGADCADWLVLLVRTDPDAPKHRGISFLTVDIQTPGITVRPLIDMADGHHVNEVFFDNVRVPVANRIGEENRGWYVAMTLLDYERSRIINIVEAQRELDDFLEFLRADESGRFCGGRAEILRMEIADRAIESIVMENFACRIITMQEGGVIPNHESSIGKIFVSEFNQKLARTATKAFGLYAGVWDPESRFAPMGAIAIHNYLRSIPATIAGGSNEIQRSLIATRGLGLPRG